MGETKKPNITKTNMDKQKSLLNFDLQLPEDVSVSTMTVTCKLDVVFNDTNIGKYIDLKHNGIVSVRQGACNDETTNRSLIIKKQSQKKTKKKAFYNQVTLIVRTKKNKIESKTTNIKLFSNGAIQMTGCKGIDNIIEVLEKVFNELKTVKATVDYKTGTIIERPFVSDVTMLDIKNVYDIKISMINSNFTIGFTIDRDKLFDLLVADGIGCSYDPLTHAGVNIKCEKSDKTTIFVFESGAVIITGAKTCADINDAYIFINKYLLKNYNKINKNNVLNSSSIIEFLNSEVPEINIDEKINDEFSNFNI